VIPTVVMCIYTTKHVIGSILGNVEKFHLINYIFKHLRHKKFTLFSNYRCLKKGNINVKRNSPRGRQMRMKLEHACVLE